MKKVLLTSICLVSSLVWGGSIDAQSTTSVKFTPSSDDKTLTISGQGDLTTYKTTDWSARIFSDKAVGYVFTNGNGTKVNEGDSYFASNTYYQASYSYKEEYKGEPTAWMSVFGAVNANKAWKAEKIANLYKGYYSQWNSSVVLQSKVAENDNIDDNSFWNSDSYENMSFYFLSDKELLTETTVSLNELKANGITLISKENLQEYYNANVSYQISKENVFKSTDSGKTYVALSIGVDYTWTSSDVFYTGTPTYAQIEDNAAFFGEDGTHPDYIKADPTELSFIELLNRKMLEGVSLTDGKNTKNSVTPIYETVKFVNENAEEPLYIDKETVRRILYPAVGQGTYYANATTTTLDLGAATMKSDFTSTTFIPTDSEGDSYWLARVSISNLTLPLTQATEVLDETSTDYANKERVVVPSNILKNFQGSKTLTTVTIPEGYQRIGNQGFANLSVENINLPATLKLIGDEAFYGCNKLNSIDLNEGLESIGEKAFNLGEASNLSAVKFPSTLKIIKDGAFLNCKIQNLKFNAGLQYIGNSAFALPAAQNEEVLEIPASVRYIGPFAFNFRQYQDVYFYGEKAPLMPLGDSPYNRVWTNGTAFSAHCLMGNNGFDPSSTDEVRNADNTSLGYANRDNYYKNNTGKEGMYFCILHYPKDLTEDKVDTYTDITRKYETWNNEDGTFSKDNSKLVGKESGSLSFGGWVINGGTSPGMINPGFKDTYLGEQYVWPSLNQFMRSYICNSNELRWDGVTPYTNELTDDEIATLRYAGYTEDKYSEDDLKKIAHMGTHQFVLANADVNVDKDEEEEPEFPIQMEGGKWWSICVPFNMTKKQIDEVFGEGTHVCRFNMVNRLKDDDDNRYLRLHFQHDVYVHKNVKDANGNYPLDKGTPVLDDDIVIYAHESYMIYPTKDNKDANMMYNIKDYQLVTGSPIPTLIEANEKWQSVEGSTPGLMADDEEVKADRTYRFVGNYQTSVASADDAGVSTQSINAVKVPQYSYIYAKKNGDTKYQFWFYTGTQMAWAANKCVVQATAIDGGYNDWLQYFGGSDNSVGAKRAKENSYFGEDSETTGVEHIEIIAGEGKDAQVVYNLNGQVVNQNGHMNSLQKGVYIKNGKKYMVK